jgi:hypothetical protein
LAKEQEGDAANPAAQTAPVSTGQAGVPGGAASPFLQVELRVSWLEAENERSVTRTIFAVDEDAAARFAAASVLSEGTAGSEQP